ncbi:MAG TPA: hypothetical protein DEP84_32915 [Chloroflexi bacterium]|nr:hypothetical protein [Chloroflexota bacterium]
MQGIDLLRELAERVLMRSPADETEVLYLGEDSSLTRFANNEIHQNVAETNLSLQVRVVVSDSVGVASTNSLRDKALDEVVDTAIKLAQVQPPHPEWPGLPRPSGVPVPVDGFVHATGSASPNERASMIERVCRPAIRTGLVASGALQTASQELMVANSHDIFVYYPSTFADFVTVVMGDSGSGYSHQSSADVTNIDVEALGQAAIEKAQRSREPIDLEPGRYDVVLEEYAVEDMVRFISSLGLGGQAYLEGRSFASHRLEERVTGEQITLIDNGLDPDRLPLPVDFEGVPRQRVMLIENGVVRNVVWDHYWANKSKSFHNTGHALPAPNTYGPIPIHLQMAPGETPKNELVKQIEHGLWVTRFNYTRTVHPMKVIVTGLTRDGTFLIENGEIVAPVKNLRFTESYLEAFGRVIAVSQERRLLKGWYGASLVPAVALKDFTFTGKTEF